MAIRGLLLSLAHQVEEGNEQDERNDAHNAYRYGDYDIHIGAPAGSATGIAGTVIQLGGAGHEEGRGGFHSREGCGGLSYGQHFVVVVVGGAVNGLGSCCCCCC